jgi:glycosyltransferase involved in cell wall biosynthesis
MVCAVKNRLAESSASVLRKMAPMVRPRFSVVIPVLNAIKHLRSCVDSVRAAIGRYQNAELIVVDNGSSDGSYETLLADYAAIAKIFQQKGITIGALRNFGARAASGDYLCFIDSDCVIGDDYFEQAASVFASLRVACAGSMYALPPQPRWIEETWDLLHHRPKDSYVRYLNSGNFIIARDVFEKIGGFEETLVTGEDAEICMRLGAAGFKIYNSQQIKAIHLGYPKTLRAFIRKQVWHGLGMFGSARVNWFDKPLLLTLAHLFLTVAGIANLFVGWADLAWRALVFVVSALLAPVAAVIYRSVQTGKFHRPLRSTFLYWLYLYSRVYALVLIAAGDSRKRARSRPTHLSRPKTK